MGPGKKGLSARYIEQAVEASLQRLGVETIDLYLSHWPDDSVPHAETLGAYQRLIAKGKIRWCGASNFCAAQLSAALAGVARARPAALRVLQPEYNLYDRSGFEGALRDFCVAEGIGVVTYYSLAKGFLAGKYRTPADLGQSPRGGGVRGYLNPRGLRIVDALASVAARHGAKSAEVALAWLIAQPGVTAPIASATSPAQVDSLIRAATLALSADDLAALEFGGRAGRLSDAPSAKSPGPPSRSSGLRAPAKMRPIVARAIASDHFWPAPATVAATLLREWIAHVAARPRIAAACAAVARAVHFHRREERDPPRRRSGDPRRLP